MQTFSFFWFSELGSLWSLLCFSSECMQSQDVTLCIVLSKGKAHSIQRTPTRWLSGYSVVEEETSTHEDLMRAGHNFFAALYGQPKCSSVNTARYMIYTKKKCKPPLVKSLPLTDKNLLLHMLRAHCQTLLWKATGKRNAPALYITEFGWENINNVPSPLIASGPPAPPDLMKIVSCQCRAAGTACSQANCNFLTASLPVQHTVSAKVLLIIDTIQWQPNMGTVKLLMMRRGYMQTYIMLVKYCSRYWDPHMLHDFGSIRSMPRIIYDIPLF